MASRKSEESMILEKSKTKHNDSSDDFQNKNLISVDMNPREKNKKIVNIFLMNTSKKCRMSLKLVLKLL